MNYNEHLKYAFEKLYRESVQEFEHKSQDLFFNNSKFGKAKQKLHNSALPAMPNEGGSKKPLTDNKTWKTTIYKRKKAPSPRNRTSSKATRIQKENLKNCIDRIFFDHLFGQKKLTGINSGYPGSMTRSVLLTRNVKNMEKRKCQSNGESKANFISESKITKRKKKVVTSTTRPEEKSQENSLELYSNLPSLDDSGVFGEDFEPVKDCEKVSLINKMKDLPRKRVVVKDDSGGSCFKKSRSLVPTAADKTPGSTESVGYRHSDRARKLNETPTHDKCKRQVTENSKHTEKPSDGKSKVSRVQSPTPAKELNLTPKYSRPVAKERRQGFQPLFSHHCGGVWKAIVDEN